MSDFLGNCLRTAIIVAFGTALLNFVFIIVTLLILSLILTGPGAVVAIAAALPLALAAAFIFGAAVLISQVVACIVADNQRAANVQAGQPGGGGQALEEEEKPPRCLLCDKIKGLVLISAIVGLVIGVIIIRT